jgi:hypothetical protein
VRATALRHVRLLLVVLLAPGCTEKTAPVNADVERVWRKHELVVEGAVLRRVYAEDEILAAVSFFEKTTGLRSPRGLDEVGLAVVPTDELGKDLERWRAWYADNKARLCLDSATGEVRLAPTPRKAGDLGCPKHPAP